MPLFGGVSNGHRRGALTQLKRWCPLRFVEGPRFGELFGCSVFEAAVWPLRVVVDPPVLNDLLRLCEAGEPMPAQALLTEASVEAFHVCVLRRLARVDEVELHAVIVRPLVHSPSAQFRAITPSDIWIATFPCDPLQQVNDPLPRQREVRFNGRTLARTVILEVGGSELAAVRERVTGEVQ